MRIECFKELDCWKKARQLVNEVYQTTNSGNFSKDFGLKDQIRRAAVSVMANIAEGFGCKSDLEFTRFLSISIRSAYEVQSHLVVASDVSYLDPCRAKDMELLANDCINLSKGLIKYLSKNYSKT